MSQIKKYTQTKLSFIVKPKSGEAPPKVQAPISAKVQAPVSKKRSKNPLELRDDKQKKLKLKTTSKVLVPELIAGSNGSAGEPEVSSSSEPVQPAAASKPPNNQQTLEPFVKLRRCDTPPKIEVTSSTSSDELNIILVPGAENEMDTAEETQSAAIGRSDEPNSTEKRQPAAGGCNDELNSTKETWPAAGACGDEPNATEKKQPAAGGRSDEPNLIEAMRPAAGACSDEPNSTEKRQPAAGGCSDEPNSTEGTWPTAGARSNEPNSTEGRQPAAGGRSDEPNSTEERQPTAGAHSDQPNSTEERQPAAGGHSDEPNSTEGCNISDSEEPNVLSPSPSKSINSNANLSVDQAFSPNQANTTLNNSQLDSDHASTSNLQRPSSKRLSASAQKRRDEQKLALEQKRKDLEIEKEKKRLQKLEEKLQKEKEAEEKRRLKAEQKEAERLAKLKDKEEKRLQKEMLQAQKQAELDAKNALKETERQKREEERKQKELERIRAEEEKIRKRDVQKNALLNYFQKSAKKELPQKTEDSSHISCNRFKPFAMKTDMRLAPVCRVKAIDVARFDDAFQNQSLHTHVYLSELKSLGVRRSQSTWPWTEDDGDVVAVVPGGKRHRAKLLQFHTDVRPAYFGTWRKKSCKISARRPITEDKERFNYEEDSADEWEEEEPGESVDSGDEDEEEKDEFDFDPELREDGFLVDHNYLSDGEGGVSDEEEEESLAAKKTKQMIARTYGKRNRRKNRLKPVVWGTVWQGEGDAEDGNSHIKLQQFNAIIFQSLPINFSAPAKKKSPQISDSNSHPGKKIRPVPEEALPDFIKIIHGCVKSAGFIIRHFQETWQAKASVILPKRQLKLTLQSMATYRKKDNKKPCWYVNEETLKKYSLHDLPAPNPIYIKASQPTVKSKQQSLSQNATPPINRPVTTPDSSQKRLTDFTQPAKKKLKIAELPPVSSSPQHRNVALITIDSSPETSKDSMAKTLKPVTQLKSSPRRISLTTISATAATPTSKPTPSNLVPRRVGITTLEPKNAIATTINAAAPIPEAQSPRRVKLTTLSTPTTSRAVDSSANITAPGTSPQTNKSPRRVQFTTLVNLSSPKKALSERSQNTNNPEQDILPLKNAL